MLKHIIPYINNKKQQFAQLPLFNLLKNNEFSAQDKLVSILPVMSHFIMSFGDLNRYVLKYPSPKNQIEEAINVHAEEDQSHWKWFIHDLKLLEANYSTTFTDHLTRLWDNSTSAVRNLTYVLTGLIYNSNAKQRLILIEVMEATGNVMFQNLLPLSDQIKRQYDKELIFCGNIHLSNETGHTIGSDQKFFNDIIFNHHEVTEGKEKINAAFDAFSNFIILLNKIASEQLTKLSSKS
ncbi:hypothetical protein [Commensalibacter oyaizuii]|uniref:Iron-containing redox enzyme family protein n=1 Tax=Commensalibacter oyaizuii TaxID=3043873 RepID=A0ABT6PZX5_9PROT|nr:hypothetical protein [Commensalibacter sp. TBRC 16381]MDI2090403.1 hypothetical protein [Commensalibacter sp. TBRC 16381]